MALFTGMELVKRALKAWDLEQHPGGGLFHVPSGRRLSFKWVPTQAQEDTLIDLKAFHGVDAEKELTIAVFDQLIGCLLTEEQAAAD